MQKLRLANSNDLPQLARLRLMHKTAEGAGSINGSAFIELFCQTISGRLGKDLEVFVIEQEGAVIACAYAVVVKKIPKPSNFCAKFVYLTAVYCQPEHRGGMGKKLVEGVKAWALQNDIEFILTWPSDQSKSLYLQKEFTSGEGLEFEVKPYID